MPGAGSQRAAQYLYSVAPKDGSVIGTMSRSMPIEPLLGDAKFDGRQFTWIGNVADTNSLCATWHESGIKTWQDVLEKPFVLGGQGPGSDLDNFAALVKNVFGAKAKLVSGYPGGSEVNLAIERREIDGRCGWSWDSIKGTRPEWLRDKKINLLVVFALEKAADVPPEVPLVLDVAKTEEQKQILRVHLAGQALGRPFAAPPGIPGRPQGRAAQGLRRDHEGPRIHRRGRQGQGRGQPDDRRRHRSGAGRGLCAAQGPDREGQGRGEELSLGAGYRTGRCGVYAGEARRHRRPAMSRSAFAMAVIAAAMLLGTVPSPAQQAQYEGPWCATVFNGEGSVKEICHFRDFESCRLEVVGGNRGTCGHNPRYAGRHDPR